MHSLNLLRLELENWAVHDKITISLKGSLQIEGRNGTGKSSILEAIRFIFSKDAKGYKGRIKNGARSAKVKLVFDFDKSRYSVEKALHIKNASTAQLSVDSKLVASNPSEVYSRLQEVLPENIIEKLLYVPQDGLVELIEKLRVKGGREELDELLGLDRFKNVYSGVKQELRDKENILKGISNALGDGSEQKEKEFLEEINQKKSERSGLDGETEKQKAALGELNSALEGIEKEVLSMRDEKKKKEEFLKKASELEVKIASASAELAGSEKSIEALSGKKTEFAGLKTKEKELEVFSGIREPLNSLVVLDRRLKEPPQLGSLRKELKAVEESLSSRESYEASRVLLRKEIDELENKKTGLKLRITDAREYIRDLRGMENKAKCPKCGQALTAEHIAYELGEAERKERVYEVQVEELRKRLFEEKKNDAELEKTLSDLQKKEIKAGHLAEKIREKERIEGEINALGIKLIDAGYSGETPAEVEEKIGELNNIRGRIKALEKDIREESLQIERIEQIRSSLKDMAERKKDLNARAENIHCNDALLEGLEKDRDALRCAVFEKKEKLTLALKEREYKDKELASLEKNLSELRAARERQETLGKEIGLLKEAADIFHTNKGIVKYLRETRITQLNKRMNHYFRMFNQNPRYRRVGFDKEYRIILETTEGELSVEQLSGGEKVQLAIALRIALITILSHNIKLLIMDEPFGSLDEEHREILGESLNRIARDWQLLLVTHIGVDSLNLLGKLELDSY